MALHGSPPRGDGSAETETLSIADSQPITPYPRVTCASDAECDDLNDCTVDTCNVGAQVCVFTPLGVGSSCGDGDPCTGDETCDGAGVCQPGTAIDCSAFDTDCIVGVCNTSTETCEPQDRGDLTLCGDDGDACDGDDVCAAGSCQYDDGSVSIAHLVPLNGVTNIAGYRARDIANNDYEPRFFTATGDPDYAASDYSSANVTLTYTRTGTFFEGHLDAVGLKPNFAYQVKLVGMPTAEFGAAGDDDANERIGYAGRWFRVGSGNSSDAAYDACKADPECDDVFQAYHVFGYFITDRFGNASYDFVSDQSLHVLWRICPPARPMTGCAGGGGSPPIYADVIAKQVSGYGYGVDSATWNIGVYGEIERTPPQAYLASGEYRCRFLLTEESFHESGVGGQWASAVGEVGIRFWINDPAGPRDCEDFDICNGYESCDAIDQCQSGAADPCDDGNPCTDDTCAARHGCYYDNNTGTCDDLDACTENDTCGGGLCAGSQRSCDDQVVCTDDSCDSVSGCQNVPNDSLCLTGQTCDAVQGCIVSTPCTSDPECDDGFYCNGAETCNLGAEQCQSGTPVDCDDGQVCNGVETCNEASDACDSGSPPDCNDGSGSTIDYCDPSTNACEHAPGFDAGTGTITDGSTGAWDSGMELGGIGVGKMEVRTNGEIGNYTINNSWDNPVYRTKGTFFAVYVDRGGEKQTRILRRDYSGGGEYSGLDAIDHVRYLGMFPKLGIDYYDSLPISLKLNAFSPLTPQNPDDSSLPIAFFTFDVTNESEDPVDVSLAFSWENILGRGGYSTWSNGSQTWNDITGNNQSNLDLPNLKGIRFSTTQSYANYQQNSVGEYLVMAEKGSGLEITTHNSWHTGNSTPDFWSQFESDGTLVDPTSPPSGSNGIYEPSGAVAIKASLAPGETKVLRFTAAWFLPTHKTASDGIDHGHAYLNDPATDTIDEIIEYGHNNVTSLEAQTDEWLDLVLDSNLPFWLKLRMINGAFTIFANSVYPLDGDGDGSPDLDFYTHESLMSMRGSLGTSDQRMSFHPYYTMLFPELDQTELTIFGDVRGGGGRVSHFNGNVGWKLHSSAVGYGVTNWPDLSCSYVMQVLKSYKWTGDATFLTDNWDDVKGAMAWLQSVDGDGDYIPEGGSTYDYEGQNPGAFVYTASAYLGALKAAEELALIAQGLGIETDTALDEAYGTRFANAQSTVMTNLWTGSYFKKYHQPGGATTTNSFIAALAGDWLSRYSTTGRTLGADVPNGLAAHEVTKSALNHLVNWHVDLFTQNVAPMEVTLTGDDPAGNCYQYQHEPYLGMESIYEGFVDEGMYLLYTIYRDHWERAQWPWNGRIHPSVYGSGKTGGWNGNYYMSNPATWSVLSALSGSSIDVPGQTLYLAPHLPTGWTELHVPLFFPKFWAWLDFDHTTGQIDLEILKTFGTPLTITKTLAELASGTTLENTTQGLPFTASVGQVLSYQIPVDNTTPSTVADLGAAWTGSDVRLSWTAPGDDGSSGRSLRYDIRYSLSPINAGNWDSATELTREPYPATSGTAQTFDVLDSLAADTTHYFAMKSKDEESNWSALSNVGSVFTGGGECADNGDCDDGLYCTGVETCDVQQQCQPGTPVDCSYLDNGCLAIGICDEGQDACVAETNTDGLPCDDGLWCNGVDTCSGGTCQPAGEACPGAGEQCNEASDTCCSGANGTVLTAVYPSGLPAGTTAIPAFEALPAMATTVDYVDIGDPLCEQGHNMEVDCVGTQGGEPCWGTVVTWGGETDGARAVWESGAAGSTSTAATLTMEFGAGVTDKFVAIRWLDGQASDAFDLAISGEATVYDLADDPGDTETWENLGIWNVGPVTGVRTLTLTATSPPWSGQETYGQVTLSEIAVFQAGCSINEDCDDGLWCNGAETCVDTVCQSGTAPDCDDVVGCTDDSCNEGTDSCDHTPDDAYCDDGLWCTGDETCSATEDCLPSLTSPCNDAVDCTDDHCDEVNDQCTGNTPNDTLCDDQNVCTDDTCNLVLGCQYYNNTESCEDGLFCTTGETCSAGSCGGGLPRVCGDGVDCTIDSCSETLDTCVQTPDHAYCDDGAYCNGPETCNAISDCQPGSPPCAADEFCYETQDACCAGWLLDPAVTYPATPSSPPYDGWHTDPPSVGLPAGAQVVDFVAIGGHGGSGNPNTAADLTCEDAANRNMEVGCEGTQNGEPCWGDVWTWGPTSGQPLHNKRPMWEAGTVGSTSPSASLTLDFGSEPIDKYIGALWLWGAAADSPPDGDSWDLEIVGYGTFQMINTDGVEPVGGGSNWNEITGVFDVGVITGVQTLVFTAVNDAWSGQPSYGQAMIGEVAIWQWECQDNADCDDGLYCNGEETCTAGICQPGMDPCDDGFDCTDDSCNEGAATCDNTPIDALCDDSDPDTVDTCDPGDAQAGADGCVHETGDLGIAGTILYYRTTDGQEPGDAPVGDVQLDLQGTTISDSTISDPATGGYAFTDLPSETMTVTPSKLGGFDGISSLDAARASQFRVQIITLTPNQQIAADVSGNGGVGSYDAALISQFRVGMIQRFPVGVNTGSDWGFIPTPRSYAPLDAYASGEDYTAILYGDVTGNWSPPTREPMATEVGQGSVRVENAASQSPGGFSRSSPTTRAFGGCGLSLSRVDGGYVLGTTLGLALQAKGCQGLLGLDLILVYDPASVSIRDIRAAGAASGFQILTHDKEGICEVSLYSPHSLESDGIVLLLDLETHGPSVLSPAITLRSAEVNEVRIPVKPKSGPVPLEEAVPGERRRK